MMSHSKKVAVVIMALVVMGHISIIVIAVLILIIGYALRTI